MSPLRKLSDTDDSKEIRFSLNFLDQIFSALPDPVFVKDHNHRWIFGNEAFSKVIGRPLKDYLYKSDYDIFPKEIADVFWKKDDEIFNLGIANENEELIQINGEIRTILTKKVPIRTDHGMILVGIIRDVTDRKNLEVKNNELNARLTQAMQSLNFGVWEWNCLTQNVKWDSIVAGLLNLSTDASEGSMEQMLSQLDINEQTRLNRRLEEALTHGGAFQEDFKLNKGPNQIILRTNAKVLLEKENDREYTKVVGTIWNVTHEYEQRKQLVNAAQISTFSEMAAGIAHDINNPIAILKGRIQQLQKIHEKSGIQDDSTNKIIKSMLDSCDRATKVVADLRKLSSSNVHSNVIVFDARDLFEEISALFKSRFSGMGIDFQVVFTDGPCKIFAVENQIRQALITLTNYSFNSVYSCENRKIWWKIDGSVEGQVTITLGDSGTAPSNIHDRTPQNGFASNAMNPSFGLGVTLSRNIIESNGGKWIEFQANSDNRFVFQFLSSEQIK